MKDIMAARLRAKLQDDFSMIRAYDLANAFDWWYECHQKLAQDPQSVSPQELTDAWDRVIDAYQEWASSR